jgi:hypothetical protein
VFATHKLSAVIAQQPICDPRLTIPVTTIEGEKEAPGLQDSADNAQGGKCVVVVKVMQQPVHHDDVGRSKLGCALFIEQPAMERAPRAKALLCVLDVALVDIKTVVLNTDRQVLEDKSWPTSDVDDLISRFDGEVGTN